MRLSISYFLMMPTNQGIGQAMFSSLFIFFSCLLLCTLHRETVLNCSVLCFLAYILTGKWTLVLWFSICRPYCLLHYISVILNCLNPSFNMFDSFVWQSLHYFVNLLSCNCKPTSCLLLMHEAIRVAASGWLVWSMSKDPSQILYICHGMNGIEEVHPKRDPNNHVHDPPTSTLCPWKRLY